MRSRLASVLYLSIRASIALATPFFKTQQQKRNVLSNWNTMSMIPPPEGEEPAPPGSSEFYEKLAISAVLVVVGGVFAGCVARRFQQRRSGR